MNLIYTSAQNPLKSEIISLFTYVDNYATGKHYNTSTADMSRDMFFKNNSNVTDETALRCFYDSLGEKIVLAFDENKLIGFTLLEKNSNIFKTLLPSKTPHIAVHFSAAHPKYQRKGVWTALRNYIETNILLNESDIMYIVTAASKENIASQKANESIGMKKQGEFNSDFENSDTILYSKNIK